MSGREAGEAIKEAAALVGRREVDVLGEVFSGRISIRKDDEGELQISGGTHSGLLCEPGRRFRAAEARFINRLFGLA